MKLAILGTRGIPAQHGGFETFAEHLALHLVEHDWQITVYCQQEGEGPITESEWCGVRQVNIPVNRQGAPGTIVFDWKSTLHAARESQDLILTLGYNTAIFCFLLRLKKLTNLINMDGIEWKRDKWSFPERAWLYINERMGCWLGNHLIADHPEIKNHLTTRVVSDKITTIPYGANRVDNADANLLAPWDLQPNGYAIVIGRPEPENSILEIVGGFSKSHRDLKLLVLGNFRPEEQPYHRQVMDAASDEVLFPGAIYDKPVVEALRFHSRLYIHGHRVGGTNPSLVEALGAGSPVLAHDNRFNRWVAGQGAHYFSDMASCSKVLDRLLANSEELEKMRQASRQRHEERFTWEQVLKEYEELLFNWLPKRQLLKQEQ